MANVSFTRDEVLLAMDVFLSSKGAHLDATCPQIEELSLLLNDLPIIPPNMRGSIFRNCSGVAQQLNLFRRSRINGVKNQHVGEIFYEVAEEFANEPEEIHKISNAIKENKEFFKTVTFGNETESEGFPEGALLGHLHRYVEKRDGRKVEKSKACDVCRLNLTEVYKPNNGDLLQVHLMVPVTETRSNKTYKQADFITVCPTCHAVLHMHRPWKTLQNCDEILR